MSRQDAHGTIATAEKSVVKNRNYVKDRDRNFMLRRREGGRKRQRTATTAR